MLHLGSKPCTHFKLYKYFQNHFKNVNETIHDEARMC